MSSFLPIGRQIVPTELQTGTGWVRVDATDGVWLNDYTKPVKLGDPDGSGNNTVFYVDDVNQKSGSNVKHETTKDITITESAKGLVLKDTAGTPHYWRLSVSTLGVITATDIGTSPP